MCCNPEICEFGFEGDWKHCGHTFLGSNACSEFLTSCHGVTFGNPCQNPVDVYLFVLQNDNRILGIVL